MKRRFVLAAFVVALVGTGLWWCIAELRAQQLGIERTEALLRNDPAVQLESFEICYQQRRVYCTDPDALRYLELCFRQGDRGPDLGGVTYLLRLRFAGGGNLDAITYWSEDGFGLYMPYQETDTGAEPRVRVAFKSPVPASIAEMVAFLGQPWKEVKGMVLVIEPGGVRREFQRSLVAK